MPWGLVGLSLVMMAPVEAGRPSWAGYAVIGLEETADDLWARGLFVSAIAHTWNPPEGLADRLFAAALERADRLTRSRILVTMGDYGAGTVVTSTAKASLDQVGRVGEKILQEVAPADRAVPRAIAQELAAVPEPAGALAESIATQRGEDDDGRLQAAAYRMLEAMAEARREERVAARGAYEAAVRIDPGNLAGWFRLVWVTEGEAQDAALAELRRRDPENALPWIATGAVLVERKRFSEAIEPLKAAAERKVCRLYPAALPSEFRLRFPKDEGFLALGISGEPVRPAALRHLLDGWKGVTDAIGGRPWDRRVQDALAWSTEDYVRASVKVGMLRQAEDLTDAAHRAGRAMLAVEPPEISPFLAAVTIARTSGREAVATHRLAGNVAAAEQVQRFLDHWDDTEQRRKELTPADPPDDYLVRIVRGERNGAGVWERYVTGMQEALGVKDVE